MILFQVNFFNSQNIDSCTISQKKARLTLLVGGENDNTEVVLKIPCISLMSWGSNGKKVNKFSIISSPGTTRVVT